MPEASNEDETATFEPHAIQQLNSETKAAEENKKTKNELMGKLIEDILSENEDANETNKKSTKSFTFDIEGDTLDRVVG